MNPSMASLLLLLLSLSSCNQVNMDGWPYVDLPFEVDGMSTLYIDYDCRWDESKSGKYYTTDKEGIKDTYDWIEQLNTNPETCNEHVSSYSDRFCAYFLSENGVMNDFKAYCFNGPSYFVYNDEIRYYPADFLSLVVDYIEHSSSTYLIKV